MRAFVGEEEGSAVGEQSRSRAKSASENCSKHPWVKAHRALIAELREHYDLGAEPYSSGDEDGPPDSNSHPDSDAEGGEDHLCDMIYL